MDRKGCVVTVALIVVMMVLLLASCSEPGLSLGSYDQQILIGELYDAFLYGLPNAPYDSANFTIEFNLPSAFSNAKFVKDDAQITVKATSQYFDIVATGHRVIGEKASLRIEYSKEGDELVVLEVLLNGKKMSPSVWPEFDSLTNSDPVLLLSIEDQQKLIMELLLPVPYGIDRESEIENFPYLFDFEVEDVFWDAKFIKKGAKINGKIGFYLDSNEIPGLYLELEATGNSVIGEKASLRIEFAEIVNELGIVKVQLNGKEIPSTNWPDFGILEDSVPVLPLSSQEQKELAQELWIAYIYGVAAFSEEIQGSTFFSKEFVLGEEKFPLSYIFNFSSAKYIMRGANVYVSVYEGGTIGYITIIATGKHVIGMEASLRIEVGLSDSTDKKPTVITVELNEQEIDSSLWPEFDVFD
jgi:hypothetical protein